MTLEISRAAFADALKAVVDVVEARTTIPILSNVLLQAADGRLTITGTDLDRHASIGVAAAGSIDTTVDARKLLVAVTSLKGDRVAIVPAEGRSAGITLKAGRGFRTLATLPSKDFPQRAVLEGATTYSLPAATLARMLAACTVAISTDETRYYLNGVYLHGVEGRLVAVATDAHRLVRAETEAPEGSDGAVPIIVPSKTVALVRKVLSCGGEIAIHATAHAIDVRAGDFRLVSKTVDGSFPDYARVIPAMDVEGTQLTVARDAILDAVGGVAAIVDAEGEQKTRRVRIDLSPAPAPHSVSADDLTGSAAREEFEGVLAGAPVAIGMNSKYFTQTIGVLMEGATLTVALADAAAPVRFASDKDPDLTVVIMPMRV